MSESNNDGPVPDVSLLVLFPTELTALSKVTTTGDRDAVFKRIDATTRNLFAIDQTRATLACTAGESINGCRWWQLSLSIAKHPTVESLDLLESSEMSLENLERTEKALLSVFQHDHVRQYAEEDQTFKTDWKSGRIEEQIRTVFGSVRKASGGDLGRYVTEKTAEAHETMVRVWNLPKGNASASQPVREAIPHLEYGQVDVDTVDWCGTLPMFTKVTTKVVPTPELRAALGIRLPVLDELRRE